MRTRVRRRVHLALHRLRAIRRLRLWRGTGLAKIQMAVLVRPQADAPQVTDPRPIALGGELLFPPTIVSTGQHVAFGPPMRIRAFGVVQLVQEFALAPFGLAALVVLLHELQSFAL